MRTPNISLQLVAKFLKWSKIFKSLGLTVTLVTSSIVTTPVTTFIIVGSSIVVFDINTQVLAQTIESGVFSGEDGVIYGMYPDGRLMWYRHDGRYDGSSNWTAGNGGRQVGTGWNGYSRVFAGEDGVIYGMYPDGRLMWYRHDGRYDGSSNWTAGNGGRQVGTGWNVYSRVFAGEDGVIYGMYPDGRLMWYRHDGWRDGSSNWTAGNGGRQVGTGWNGYSRVFAGEDGVIYGMYPDGRLMWYRHDGWRDGSFNWTAGNGGRQVGTGWNGYSRVFAGEDGVIYGMYPDGRLMWYRHDGWRDGSSNWTAGNGGRQVGTGWDVFRQ